MPFQHPEEIGYGYVIERYAARKDSGHARYLVLKSGRFLRPGWPHAEHFVRHLIDDSATITDVELERSSGYAALDLESQRAPLLTRQLPALPAQFPDLKLTVHRRFQYQR